VIQAFQRMGAWMAKQVYWLSDAEWQRIELCCRAGGAVRIGSMIVG
jgi:hypothetical protein